MVFKFDLSSLPSVRVEHQVSAEAVVMVEMPSERVVLVMLPAEGVHGVSLLHDGEPIDIESLRVAVPVYCTRSERARLAEAVEAEQSRTSRVMGVFGRRRVWGALSSALDGVRAPRVMDTASALVEILMNRAAPLQMRPLDPVVDSDGSVVEASSSRACAHTLLYSPDDVLALTPACCLRAGLSSVLNGLPDAKGKGRHELSKYFLHASVATRRVVGVSLARKEGAAGDRRLSLSTGCTEPEAKQEKRFALREWLVG